LSYRTCTIDNCGKKHLARGLCSTHYNQQHQPDRHRKVELACGGCGSAVLMEPSRSNRYANIYCTVQCRTEHQHREVRASRRQLVPHLATPVLHTFIARMPKPSRASTRTFKSGQCRMCATWFLDLFGSSTCSDTCQAEWYADQKRNQKQRRRALKRGAFVAPVYRNAIYERDGWTCQLCFRPIPRTEVVPHPDAPTIDHVLALASGGTHEPGNVQAAHFLCNALKGAREHVFELTSR
jgi:hypothetical protein